ncbi:hypothetical protein PYCC9005_003644 [Savitreella phatthalungensis]
MLSHEVFFAPQVVVVGRRARELPLTDVRNAALPTENVSEKRPPVDASTQTMPPAKLFGMERMTPLRHKHRVSITSDSSLAALEDLHGVSAHHSPPKHQSAAVSFFKAAKVLGVLQHGRTGHAPRRPSSDEVSLAPTTGSQSQPSTVASSGALKAVGEDTAEASRRNSNSSSTHTKVEANTSIEANAEASAGVSAPGSTATRPPAVSPTASTFSGVTAVTPSKDAPDSPLTKAQIRAAKDAAKLEKIKEAVRLRNERIDAARDKKQKARLSKQQLKSPIIESTETVAEQESQPHQATPPTRWTGHLMSRVHILKT